MDKELLVVQEEILLNFPQLDVRSISFAGEGMDSKAYVINDGYIFRFPKDKKVAKQLEIEIVILPQLKKYLELSIPYFDYVGKDSRDFPFVGYQKISGVQLTKQLFESLKPDIQETIIEQLSALFRQLRSFPCSEAKRLGVKTADFYKSYNNDRVELRKSIYHLLDDDIQRYLENLLEQYLSVKENFIYTPVLLHADLSSDHIFYDPKQKRLSGIIDFGDIEIGDPDYELMYLYLDYGKDFVSRLVDYGWPGDKERTLRKAEFFSNCDIFHDLWQGIYKKDKKIVTAGLKRLHNHLRTL